MAYGFTPASTTWTNQSQTVAEQLRLASRGSFIKAYNEVTTPGSFFNAPSSVRSAYLSAAYWLAIAGRLGYTGVLSTAGSLYKQAQTASTSTNEAQRRAPLTAAGAALTAAGAAKDKRAAPIFSVLSSLSASEALARSEALQSDISAVGQVKGALAQTARDVRSPFDTVAALWSGKKPKGMSDLEWTLKKYGFWFVVLGGTALVGYVYVRPLLAPLTRVRDAAARAGHRAAAKAEGKLDRLASNPRRRRRRSHR